MGYVKKMYEVRKNRNKRKKCVLSPAEFSHEIGRLAGQLQAFAYLNNKTNHGYSFELWELSNNKSMEMAIIELPIGVKNVTLTTLDSWEEFLAQCLEKWLFSFQHKGTRDDNTLQDAKNYFSLSHSSFKEDFILDLLVSIDELIDPIQGSYVNIKVDGWYECAWDDIAIEGKKGNIFIHLGVSD